MKIVKVDNTVICIPNCVHLTVIIVDIGINCRSDCVHLKVVKVGNTVICRPDCVHLTTGLRSSEIITADNSVNCRPY